MPYQIEPRKIAGVVHEASRAIDGHAFNHGEVIVGLAELTGRIIVDAAANHIQMKEMVKAVTEHLERTIIAGNEAKGKNLIERV